jgi:diacylglycerol kinase family enzyme
LPRDVAGFLKLLASGRAQRVDTASVNGDMISFLVTGVGFDAAVVRAMEQRRKGPITKLAWVRAGFSAFFTWSAPALEVEVDGQRVPGDIGQVLISNIVHYAGFDVLAPDRVLDDGLFEVYTFEGRSKASFLAHALRGALSRFPSGSVSMRRGKHIVVRSNVPAPFHIDGDYRGETPLDMTVGSNPFRILVP